MSSLLDGLDLVVPNHAIRQVNDLARDLHVTERASSTEQAANILAASSTDASSTAASSTYASSLDVLDELGPDAAVALLRELDADACRRSLPEFVRMAWLVLHPGDPLEWSWHHDALCDHMQWLLEGWMRRQRDQTYVQPARQLAISLAPSTLKTEILMVFAPAWMWLRWPQWRVLCLSCNPRVALESAVLSRRVIESEWYQSTFQPKWQLRDDQNAKSNFGTTAGGQRQSHGMDATVVGEHAQCLLIDDPTDPKNVTRAELERVARDWPSIKNRVTDDRSALRIGIQQRLDVDDWVGTVTAKPGWISVVMPLELELARRCATPMPVDAANRLCLNPAKAAGTWRDPRNHDGDLLQPPRYPPDVIAELKLSAGPYVWSSQYQQNPRPREGGRVKSEWLQYFRLEGHHAGDCKRPPGTSQDEARLITSKGAGWKFDNVYITVDPANKKTQRGSLYGILVVGCEGARRFVLDDRSIRGEIDIILDVLRDTIREWHPTKMLIEDTAAGPTLVRALTEEFGSGKFKDDEGKSIICEVVPLTPKEVGGDKEARLDGVINQFAARLIYLLEGASWLSEFVGELTLFPNGPTADRVDAFTQLLAVTRASVPGATGAQWKKAMMGLRGLR